MHQAYSACKVRLILVDVDLMIRPKEEMGDTSKTHLIKALEQATPPPPPPPPTHPPNPAGPPHPPRVPAP